jgi:UDP:flavonoid glycosyltransferase YjiC (YdhE family)
MARFLFLTFDGGGNHPPTIGIATEMQRRGHSVTVVGYETQRSRFQDAGLPFEVFPRTGSYVQASGQEMEIRMALLREIANPDQVTEVRELVADYDGILVDSLMPVRVFTAAALPQPTAVLFHTAAAFFKPSPMLSVFLGAINPVLQGHGLTPVTNLLDYPDGIDRAIVATLPELDEYSQEAGPRWHWVGPVPGPAPESLDAPLFERGDQRPLVVVGLTTHTAYGSQTERMQRILDALSMLPVRVVAGTGIAIERAALRVPSNAVVRDYVSHRAVMPDAAACVTHAGHGTLTEALMRGVPLVCLPNPMSDQTYLAQRVKALGAGVQIDQDSRAEAISEAVQTVLSTSSFRLAAKSLQARIGEGGAGRAAEVLEAMVSVPVSGRGKKE